MYTLNMSPRKILCLCNMLDLSVICPPNTVVHYVENACFQEWPLYRQQKDCLCRDDDRRYTNF